MSEPSVTVNPASRITAAQWVELIKQSDFIPPFAKQGIRFKGNAIVGPAEIRQPAGRLPSIWPDDFAAAFASGHWEVTTAEENFRLIRADAGFRVWRSFDFDLRDGEFGPGFWLKVGPGQREWSPDTREEKAFELNALEVVFGATFSSAEVNKHAKAGQASAETRLASGRALIAIVNRVRVSYADPYPLHTSLCPAPLIGDSFRFYLSWRQFDVPEYKLVSSFFHELAAHAGRLSKGKGADHGEAGVELNVQEIEEPFPKDPTLHKVHKSLVEAVDFLTRLSRKSSECIDAENRRLGSLIGASTKGRSPGPLR